MATNHDVSWVNLISSISDAPRIRPDGWSEKASLAAEFALGIKTPVLVASMRSRVICLHAAVRLDSEANAGLRLMTRFVRLPHKTNASDTGALATHAKSTVV